MVTKSCTNTSLPRSTRTRHLVNQSPSQISCKSRNLFDLLNKKTSTLCGLWSTSFRSLSWDKEYIVKTWVLSWISLKLEFRYTVSGEPIESTNTIHLTNMNCILWKVVTEIVNVVHECTVTHKTVFRSALPRGGAEQVQDHGALSAHSFSENYMFWIWAKCKMGK